MSKQRNLLTAALVLGIGLLSAQTGFTLKTDLSLLKSDAGDGYSALNRLTWDHSLAPGLSLHLGSNLNLTDRIISTNIQKLWHNGEAGLRFASRGLEIQAGYRNLAYHGSQILNFFPVWDPAGNQERLTQHQGTLSAAYEAEFLQAGAYAQAKYLRYTPYLFDFGTFTLVPQPDEGASDVYYGAEVSVPLTGNLTARLAADHKDGLFAEQGEYRLTRLTGGLAAEYKLTGGATAQASFDWSNRSGDAIPDQRRNLLRTTLRLQNKIRPELSAFVYFVNNSCVDQNLSAIYLISNNLRAHLQYSFLNDPSGGSYILVGGKYSPENKASAGFLEGDYRVWGDLYAGAGLNFQPDRQTLYSGKIAWFYSPLNELHLQYTHHVNLILDQAADYWGLGTSIYW